MRNVLPILGVLFCCNVLVTETLGFQTTTTTTTKTTRTLPTSSRRTTQTYYYQRQQQQQQQQQHPRPLQRLHRRKDLAFLFPLHAFGGGGGGGNGFGNNNNNNKNNINDFFNQLPNNNPASFRRRPIQSKRDVLERLQFILTSTFRQFTSGFMSGYLLGTIWGWIRGPSLTVTNRGFTWGLDFGVLAALFASTNSVMDFVLEVWKPKKSSSSNNNNNNDDDSLSRKRQQKASLWSVVIRNMLLAIYFGRNGGILPIARSALIYGGLTYYFVGNKMKRDAERMSSMFGNTNNNMMGGGFGVGTNSPSAQAMQQLMQQIMTMQQQQQQQQQRGRGPASTTTTTTGMGNAQPKQTSTGTSSSSSSSSTKNETNQVKKDNVVDVEFEKIETDEK